MALTLSDFTARILRLLNDVNQRQYDDSLLYDAVIGAHDAILPWVPKFAKTTLTAGSAGDLYTLPTDCYQIQALQLVDSGLFIPRATLAPRTARNSGTYTSDNDWIDYPSGYVSLSQALAQGSEIDLYYLAFWGKPVDEADLNFVLEVPAYAHQGMLYYAGSHCLLPKAVNTAQIRQFAQRIDSGNPEDNPLKAESEWLLQRFGQEMKLMPPYVKVTQ